MKPTDPVTTRPAPPPLRLVDTPPRPDDDDNERAAVGLLDQVPAPAAPASLERMEMRIRAAIASIDRDAAPGAGVRYLRVAAAAALAVLLFLVGFVVRTWRVRPERPAVATKGQPAVSTPTEGGSSRSAPRAVAAIVGSTGRATALDGGPGAKVALVGAGVAGRGVEADLVVEVGRLALSTGDRPLRVDAPGAQVLIPPRSVVEIEVIEHEVRVAAYAGRARVTWTELGRTVEIAEGSALTQERATVVDLTRRKEVADALGVPAEPAAAGSGAAASRARRTMPAREPIATAAPEDGAERLLAEADLLRRAVAQLRRDGDPAGALAVVREYQAAFPSGALVEDVRRTEVECLLELGRRAEALLALDAMPLERAETGRELRVVRGELRAAAGRCGEALSDFDVAGVRGADGLSERTLYGRASCRTRLGDLAEGRSDLERYLSAFPQGRFVTEVKTALGKNR
jgi:hypothetical protein